MESPRVGGGSENKLLDALNPQVAQEVGRDMARKCMLAIAAGLRQYFFAQATTYSLERVPTLRTLHVKKFFVT